MDNSLSKMWNFNGNFIGVSATHKRSNGVIPKSIVAEPVATVVDLKNGFDICFKTSEILRFKLSFFNGRANKHKPQPTHICQIMNTRKMLVCIYTARKHIFQWESVVK